MNRLKITLSILVPVLLTACSTTELPQTDNTQPQATTNPHSGLNHHVHSGIPNHTHEHYQQRPPEQAPLSNAQRFSGALDAHNKVRAKHRLKPLRWSNKLAQYSQQWVNQLGSGRHCAIRHRSQTPYGENIYRSGAVSWSDGRTEISPVTIRQVVKSWTDEERWFDYNRNRCQPGKKCGHYTQAVWRDTTEVGCAMKVCADKSQTWVCSYNPPGNFIGKRPY